MIEKSALWSVVLSAGLILAGCANLPKAEHPHEIQKTLGASAQDTWDAALEAAKALNGEIILTDKDSGLIVLKVFDSKQRQQAFLSILVEQMVNTPTSAVYAILRARSDAEQINTDGQFFAKMQTILSGR